MHAFRSYIFAARIACDSGPTCELIIARSTSAVTPSEKSSISTNRKSTMHFPMSVRWSSYVAPNSPTGGSKTKIGRFSSKIALLLMKVCYKVSLCENCQRQCCMAFIGLTKLAKIIGGGRPLLPEILSQSDCVGAKSPIFDIFSLLALQPLHLAREVQLTLIGSPLRDFRWAQDEHRTLSHNRPKGGGVQNAKRLHKA